MTCADAALVPKLSQLHNNKYLHEDPPRQQVNYVLQSLILTLQNFKFRIKIKGKLGGGSWQAIASVEKFIV